MAFQRLFRLSSHPAVRWWWGLDRLSVGLIVAIMGFGLFVVALASSAVQDTYGVGTYYFAIKQAIFLAVAVPLMLLISSFKEKGIKTFAYMVALGAAVGVVLTLVLGYDVKGAQRWIYLAGVSVQPTEFLKPAMAVVTAAILSSAPVSQLMQRMIISGAILAGLIMLIFLQPDFGMVLMLLTCWGVQVVMAGLSWMWIGGLLMLGSGVIVGAFLLLPHVRSRVERYFDPSSGDSYQVDQARDALLSGGFLGRGPGEGVVKHSLPDAHTDFIFAVIGEELGLITCGLLLFVYAWIILRSCNAIFEKEDRFAMIAGCGLITLFAMQVLVNTGVVLNLLPTTGMTLPFISYGGSATVSMAITVGFILALSRRRGQHVIRNRKQR